jgi:transposase
MEKNLPRKLDTEILKQLIIEQVVEMIIEEGESIEKLTNRVVELENEIEKLTNRVVELENEIEKLKVSRDLDSIRLWKAPSGDILKKSENKQQEKLEENHTPKRKPGGQAEHRGKTRKEFGGVDRFEILGPQVCGWYGQGELFG